ncbi:MAG TPA: hypothetical protein PKE63_09995 [Lacibacter sp.]|nr:hypothetical protein [Lacibacter sp.]HMO88001.1 hypothetical protein [Lacibacter sp.]HMP87598.1 hypothetical protein [Lacibacter sp.]
MQEQPISEQESLQIIRQMIATAKQEQKDDGMGWILWGWLLFAGSTLSFLNQFTRWVNDFFFWNLFGFLSLIMLVAGLVRSVRPRTTQRVRTYTNELYSKLNVGFFMTLILIIVSINVGVRPSLGFGLLLALYGFWMLIYGALMHFRPSVAGAWINWALALATLLAGDFKWAMLFHAVAVLAGYIVPGHMAYAQFKRGQE